MLAAWTPNPFPLACERNRNPNLAVLRRHFVDCGSALEVGRGTGQHVAHFCWRAALAVLAVRRSGAVVITMPPLT